MKTQNPDLRDRVKFPPRPTSTEEIFCSPAEPWLLACSLAGKFDRWQCNTFHKLYIQLDNDELFRDVLDATRIIFDESRNIIAPAAFLVAQLKLATERKGFYR